MLKYTVQYWWQPQASGCDPVVASFPSDSFLFSLVSGMCGEVFMALRARCQHTLLHFPEIFFITVCCLRSVISTEPIGVAPSTDCRHISGWAGGAFLSTFKALTEQHTAAYTPQASSVTSVIPFIFHPWKTFAGLLPHMQSMQKAVKVGLPHQTAASSYLGVNGGGTAAWDVSLLHFVKSLLFCLISPKSICFFTPDLHLLYQCHPKQRAMTIRNIFLIDSSISLNVFINNMKLLDIQCFGSVVTT